MPDWEKAYREASGPLFGDEPTDFVRSVVGGADFDGRSALCLADGDGRNGRWLARQGLVVAAVDISKVATQQACEKDLAAGATVERIVADLETWSPPALARWDAVFVIFLQCPSAIRNGAIERCLPHISPGGWLVCEGFARERSGMAELGPKEPDLLYDIAELEVACAGLDVLEATVGSVELSEGTRHQGVADVVRFVARRGS